MTVDLVADWLLLLHAAATLFMAGVIWFVQVVHYPLFGGVGETGFPRYQREHVRRTARVVVAPMLAELGTAVVIAWIHAGPLAWSGLALLLVIWLSTWRWQVPAHRALEGGFDAIVHRWLVRANWVRTVAWSARSVIALALIAVPRS